VKEGNTETKKEGRVQGRGDEKREGTTEKGKNDHRKGRSNYRKKGKGREGWKELYRTPGFLSETA
jgi:hypothetical protein